MSVLGVNSAASATSFGAVGKLYLQGAKEFSQTLNIGQIIEGKVLRHFDGTRYLVAFGDHERVVESALTLTAGEVLQGRVIGLGEQVELQRVREDAHLSTSAGEPVVSAIAQDWRWNGDANTIDELLQRYRVDLNAAERLSMQRISRSAEDSEALGLAGAVLNKQGLTVSRPLLEALYHAQFNKARPPSQPTALDQTVPQVFAVWDQAPSTTAASTRELAEGLYQIMKSKERPQSTAKGMTVTQEQDVTAAAQMKMTSPDAPVDPRTAHDPSLDELADWILNAQTGGTVSHRLGVLPLILGGRLVEINVALFEQGRDSHPNQRLQHRQVMFSLRTEHLGHVQVVARVAGEHVRIQITTSNPDSTTQAAQHTGALQDALAQSAWNVDEISYETRVSAPHNGVVRSVIEHVISQDSLNRLI